jgi:20S proteasome alpha/beta subunit
MTTLVGIVASKGTPGVVLASDLTSTCTSWEEKGDVVYKKLTRTYAQKVYIAKSNDFAVCMAGISDHDYNQFLFELLEGKIPLKPSLEKGHFEELFHLNYRRFGGKTWNGETQNSLLIASRYEGKPKLYTCWPLGLVEERRATSIGSGSQHALQSLSEKKYLSLDQVNLSEAISMADSALERAATDIYTGGFDMVVVTPHDIRQYGQEIQFSLTKAKIEAMSRIKREIDAAQAST